MKKGLFSLLLPLLLLGLPGRAPAQPTSGGPQPQAPAAPTDTPLDGGASLLLAGGVAYGLKRLRQRRAR